MESFPEPDVELPAEPSSAALVKLGAEGLQRLRARYAELLARISERVTDPARAEELKALAERLNPDTWVTDAEVSAGLEEYEAVFSSLREVVGRRRKRRKRRPGQPRGPETPPSAPEAADSEAGEPDPDELGPGDPEP